MHKITLFDFSGHKSEMEVPEEANLIQVGHKFYVRSAYDDYQFMQVVCYNMDDKE